MRRNRYYLHLITVCISLNIGLILGILIAWGTTVTTVNSKEVKNDFLFSNALQNDSPEISSIQFNSNCYVYNTLSTEEKYVYNEIYYTIMYHLKNYELSTLDETLVENAFKAVAADHGEIFWENGYYLTSHSANDTIYLLEFTPKYTYTLKEREKIQQQIDDVVAPILEAIHMNSSDYDKAKYVFDWLSTHVDYQLGVPDDQNIISVFLYGKTVCQGYANATQYLLSKLGIQCCVVTGKANYQAHSWNLVKLDGDYYYLDSTLSSAIYKSKEGEQKQFVNYNYFAITTQELLTTHTPNYYFPLPECTAIEDNYFYKEGMYFSTWNPALLGGYIVGGYEKGNCLTAFKFASEELYEKAKRFFIAEQNTAYYCPGLTEQSYLADDKHYILTFHFE